METLIEIYHNIFMRMLKISAQLCTMLVIQLLGLNSAWSQCANPAGEVGEIIYNTTYHKFAGCMSDDTWQALHDDPNFFIPGAVYFDGAVDLRAANVRTPTKTFTLSLWFKKEVEDGRSIFESHNTDLLSIGADESIQFMARGQINDPALRFTLPAGTVAVGTWHHLLISADLNGANPANILVYFDDAPVSPNILTLNDDLLTLEAGAPPGLNIGEDVSGEWIGGMSEFWWDDVFMDLTLEPQRRKFVDGSGGPVFLGTNGQLPTGSSPDVFLSGDVNTWHLNKGTGGGFSETDGALEATLSPMNTALSVSRSFPTLGFQFSAAYDNFDVQGQYAYSVQSNTGTFRVTNISNKSAPSIQGSVSDVRFQMPTEPGARSHVLAAGNYVFYLNAETDRILTVDVSDKSNPSVVAETTIDPVLGAQLWRIGDTMFGLTTIFSLRTYDFSNPLDVQLLDELSISDNREHVVVGDYVYQGLKNGGIIATYDFSDPSDIRFIGNATPASNFPGGENGDLTFDGSFLLFVREPYAWTYDISDRENPVEIERFYSSDGLDGTIGRGPYGFNGLIWLRDNSNNQLSILRVVDGGQRIVQASDQSPAPGGNNTRFPEPFIFQGNYVFFNSQGGLGISLVSSCSNPNGATGEIIYNSSERVFQGCTNYYWTALHEAGTGGGGCSSPTGATGEIIYNSTENLYQGCTVDGWHAFHQ